ncbi:type I-E CRISPR-associated protein Cas5/CasD [Proteus columbae]|uniref:type I-E CRISPR-associated protein Cas5/CasD n=1 Tax=Proteus columbae TaxID=1987580 RepID=UPI000C1F1EC1|nr:type I-E CRISPR-associated protein Cas5/CasD [Proteus columbae]
MAQYLVFRLYGSLASWGLPAVGGDRQTGLAPSRSAILGFLGAALGIKREDEQKLVQLQQSILIATKQIVPSTLLRDFHTAQVPSTRKNVIHSTRRSELAERDLNTVLSSRDYRCDAIWIVAIKLTEIPRYTLKQLQDALLKPVYILSLGRKSCPLSLPMMPQIVETEQLRDALDTQFPNITTSDKADNYWFSANGWMTYFWEGNYQDIEGENIMTLHPWDEPVNRQHWQFRQREMYQMSVKKEGE